MLSTQPDPLTNPSPLLYTVKYLPQYLFTQGRGRVGCPPKLVSIRNNRNWNQKLVSALSETKCLFRLFRFYTETESFDVWIELKQTEDQPKQFDREHILLFLTENFGFFRFLKKFFFFVFFGLFRNSLFWLFQFYTETESFDVLIEPKQTEDQPKQFVREYIWIIFRKFKVVSVCYETVLFVSVVWI
jgi:hypothetical protein